MKGSVKNQDRFRIIVVYASALVIGMFLTQYLDAHDAMGRLFFIDLVLTVWVFVFSYRWGNASVYDPYWSVIPFYFLFYWAYSLWPLSAHAFPAILFCTVLIGTWSWRLTYNWLRGWEGMHHEDWRYRQLRQQTGYWYPLVNFLGIHLFPTLIVFAASIPMVDIFSGKTDYYIINWIGLAVGVGGVIIERTADSQLHHFKKEKKNKGLLLTTGIWKYTRHPNYLGEMMVWVGLSLWGWHSHVQWTHFLGAFIVCILFIFISVPMMEKRLRMTRQGYDEYVKSSWPLFPKLW